MKKNEVKDIVKDELNKFIENSLDNEIKKLLSEKNSKTRKEVIDIIKDALEAVYKLLWMKKDFWKSDIK